jgi:5-methylcytosine-specific restriction endonuclease McrA
MKRPEQALACLPGLTTPSFMRNDSMAPADSTRPIITRAEANGLGLKRFFTGKPCVNGHMAERFASDGKCTECNRVACIRRHAALILKTPGRADALALKRQVAAKRAEQQQKAHAIESAIRHARQTAIASSALTYVGRSCPKGHDGVRYTKHGSCVACAAEISASDEKKRYDKLRQVRDRELLSAQGKKRYQQNRAARLVAAKEWFAKNPERRRSIAQSYKHRRRAQEQAGISGPELNAWKKAARKVCYWCGKKCEKGYCVDHYEPLSKGGKHEASNLVIACRSCNSRKSAKDPEQFRAETWHGTLFSSLIDR